MSVRCPKCKGTAVLEYYHSIKGEERIPYKIIRCTEAGEWHGSGFTNCKTEPELVTQEEMDEWDAERRKPKPQKELCSRTYRALNSQKGCGKLPKRGGL